MATENDNIDINVGINASKAETGGRAARSAIKGVADEGAALQAMYRRMQTAIDPAFAALDRYNKAFSEHRQLLAAGIISGQEFAAANRAIKAELEANRTAVERSSQAYRDQQAAQKTALAQQAADQKAAGAAARAEAAATAAAAAQSARELTAQKKAALAQQRADDAAAAAAAKATARQLAADQKQAANDAADAIKAAKRAQAQADRDAATAAQQAAKTKRDAERQATAASQSAAEASRRAAIEERSLARAEQELRASIDPVYAAQMRYNQTMQQATALLMQNRLQTGEWARIQAMARQQMDLNTRSLGRQNMGYVNLGYQVQDVVASAASGINPMVILAQQGGQTASAIANMGGRFSGVASFIAGPWGAAIMGAVVVLGLLIPKLLGAASASDQMKASQENLKQYIDSTTGAMNAQITATQRLGAAKNEADQAEKKRKARDSGVDKVTTKLQMSTVDLSDMDTPGAAPAEVTNPRSVALIEKWTAAVKAGTLPVENLAIGLRNLGRQDPAVQKVYLRLQDGIKTTQDLDQEARKLDAAQRVYLGTASEADKKLMGLKSAQDDVSESYLNAQATLKTTTDSVVAARNRQTIAEADAARVRKAAIASGGNEKKANDEYIKSVAPFIAATAAAEKAKSDASKQASSDRKAERQEESEAKKAALEDLRWRVETLDNEKQLNYDSYSEQVRIQKEKIAALTEFYGEQSKEVARAQRELQSAEKKHNDEMLQMERERIASQATIDEGNLTTKNSAGKSGFDQAGDNVGVQESLGILSARQAIETRRTMLAAQYQMEVNFENDLYALKLKSLNDQLALLPKESTARQQMNNTILQLTASHDNQLTSMAVQNARDVNKVNLDVIQNTASKWHMVTDSVASSFSQMFQNMWMHSGNFKTDLLNVADQIVFKFADAGLKMASDWAANELAKTARTMLGIHIRTAAEAAGETAHTGIKAGGAATRAGITAAETTTDISATAAKTGAAVTGEAIKTGAKVAGTAADTGMTVASATTEIGARAATSAAGAFSSTVVIPFIGPVAAPVAAAAALAAVLGFTALISAKGGMGEVPGDQLAMVHKKEMILPAWIADPLRTSLKRPSSQGVIGNIGVAASDARAATHMGASGAGGPTFNYQPQHTNMGSSFEELLRRDGSTLRKWIKNQHRNGAFKVG